jgi:hypothetical protein
MGIIENIFFIESGVKYNGNVKVRIPLRLNFSGGSGEKA